MENLDNIAKNSLEALSKDNLTEKGKKKLKREIISGAIALVCLFAGLLCSWIFPHKTTVPALFYTIGFLIEGIPVLVVAIKGVFSKNLENAMEMLVAIAIIACYFSGDLILALLVPLILNIAHILEERSIMGGRDVIDGLRKMQQSTAILISGDKETVVDAKTLKVGQKILVKPGAGIPIDGVVISGETNIDQKSLTGEPQPAHATIGDTVYAGTVNIDGKILTEGIECCAGQKNIYGKGGEHIAVAGIDLFCAHQNTADQRKQQQNRQQHSCQKQCNFLSHFTFLFKG